ncbi:MAG TPA: type VI secretion system baseplate subunit TssK [Planctomycetota bacterium]|nr:type VI secretion system baseplate subunit TssK [Planctomycetota bacterium]
MTDTLARIDWQMGQTLLPEHFVAQEDAILADTATRFGLLGLPCEGIGRLKWNDSLLAEGILSLVSGTIVLSNGQVIDVPGNAVANTFNLNVPGTTKVPVYLHLTSERATQSGGAPRADGEEQVERVVHRVALVSEPTYRTAVQTLKLAEFEKNLEEAWVLAEDYCPPLLQVGTSPFLAGLVDKLVKSLELFHYKLQEEIAASYLGGEGLSSAKSCLRAVYGMERFLANIKAEVHVHPYHLYEELKRFYTELCLYQNATPESVASPYKHGDLAGCLALVTKPLFDQMQVSKGKTPYMLFDRAEGLLQIREIPREARVAKEVYFLLQKSRVSDTLSMDGIKLASRARLPLVHQLSLQGIPLRRIERPPFQHTFGAEVEFFLLAGGEEWDHALREGSIALFDGPKLASAKAYLFWRNA